MTTRRKSKGKSEDGKDKLMNTSKIPNDERKQKTPSHANNMYNALTTKPTTAQQLDHEQNSKMATSKKPLKQSEQKPIVTSRDGHNEQQENIVMEENESTRYRQEGTESDDDDNGISEDDLTMDPDQQPGAIAIPGTNGGNRITTTPSNDSRDDDHNDINESNNQTEEVDFVPVEVVGDEELVAKYNVRDEVERRLIEGLNVATEVDITEQQEENNNSSKRIWKYSLIFGLVLVIIAIALSLFFSRQKASKKDNTPTDMPSLSPGESDVVYLQQLLTDISGSTLFYKPSDQYRTLTWLVYDDPLRLDVQETDTSIVITRYVVVLLYFSTNGPDWINDYKFLSNTSVCDWNNGNFGIGCNVNGELVDISIRNNNLDGSIPSELSAIASIERIDFPDNNLIGTIPSSLGNLTNLDFLQLSWNPITGSIPNSFENLRKLENLSLYTCILTGTIPENMFRNAVDLEYINIAVNYISGTIPSDFGSKKTRFINFGDNNLEGTIPESIFALPRLEVIGLFSNSITGSLPSPEIGASQYLEFIALYENLLTGSIPSSFGSLIYLKTFSLGFNKLSGPIPTEIGHLIDLTTFEFAGNQLTGTIPSEIGLLTNMVDLYAYSNNFIGTLPSTFVMLTNLENVDFSDTNIRDDLDVIFCTDYREMKPITYMSADCGGSKPQVTCSCCTLCYNDDSGTYETNFDQVCKVNSIPIESGEFFNDENLQSICNCTGDGTSVSCRQEDCESCNEDGTICGIQTDYGLDFDVYGLSDAWRTSFTYIGQNTTVSFYHRFAYGERRVYVNGEECMSCNLFTCSDEFKTLEIECRNLIDDDSGYYNGCQTPPYSGGVFDVFDMYFTRTWTGCKPFWFWDNQL